MSASRLVVLGAGGHGKVVADAARAAGLRVLAFADADPSRRGAQVFGLPVLEGQLDELCLYCAREGAAVVVAIGHNRARQAAFDGLRARGARLASVVHPSALISPDVIVGAGAVIFAGAIVNVSSVIGDNAIVNTGARLDHDNVLGAHAHVSPGVCTGGEVRIGEGTHLGVGVNVRNRVSIGAWSLVGVGAAVVGDLPDGVVAYGVPARTVRVATA
ncbi:MAG TPA: acetyltransferase [Polyangiaceae bacterium]|nr:acetyltransferase [Polyangiaceae bacterium]